MRFKVIVVVSLLAYLGTARSQTGAAIDVREVKYDGLTKEVLKNRGKVVVVDFWQTTCIPCKKEFPHVLEMHKKYADQGLVTISVALDPVDEDSPAADRRARVLRDLRKFSVNVTNLLLDESPEVWEKKLRIAAVPCIFVFNRQGKWVQFGGKADEVPTAKVEKLVVEMLGEKQ